MTATLFALATAPGRAAVAVVRLTGPSAGDVTRRLSGPLPRPRRASLRTIRDAQGAPIDRALVLWFPGPASYTGENSAEFQLHGGQGVIDAVSRALLAAGALPAGPGDFTRRAFENGRLDLDQAEAVADLVDSETTAQARQALGQLDGRLGRRYQAWRDSLVEALAQLEAAVDFPDEEIPDTVAEQARSALTHLVGELEGALSDQARGRRVREGYRVAVIGAPNAGKSSLFNALVGRDAAIVTAAAGTTRDIIEGPIVLDGYRVLVADMAGLRASDDAIEAEGVRRAMAWASQADARLWVVDGSDDQQAWRLAADMVRAGDLTLINKTDLPAGTDTSTARAAAERAGASVAELSLVDGDATIVLEWIAARARKDMAGRDFPAVTHARHAVALRESLEHLRRGLSRLNEPELAAEDARLAARALARITGRVDAEDVLARLFASFCIGK